MPADAPQVKVDGTRARRRRDRLLRPPDREPRGDRRANRRRDRRNRGAELRRSGDRRRAGHGRPRDRRAARPCAGADRHPVRRRRACLRHRAGVSRGGDRRSSSPKAGTTWAARSSTARSCRSRRRARHLLRCAHDAARVADHLRHPARAQRQGAVGQRRRSRRGDPLRLGASTGWWSSPARRSVLPRCSRASSRRCEDTVVVLSGGNIDPALHARIIGEAA